MPMTREQRLARLSDRSPRICPSLLNCDFGYLADEIADAQRCGAEIVHWDVMDGDFVPNFSYGPPLIQSLRPRSDLIFDVHLMVEDPAKYLPNYLKAGADSISAHIEVLPDPRPLLKAIADGGAMRGLAINPPTPLESLLPWLDDVDHVLVMSVMPGFGGQSFDPDVLSKVRKLKDLKPDLWVEIDGGINPETIGLASQAGATLFVVGSAFYNADNRAEVFGELTRRLEAGRSNRG